ncbi:MAG: fibronectin type III domain-containing protein [Puniceicoccaceae bacterium]
MNRVILCITLLMAIVSYGDIVIPYGASWNYLDDGSNQGTGWRSPSFDDSAWPSGSGQLGYGDSDEETTVASGHITYYFRKDFTVAYAPAVTNATISVLYDDGAIVYVNGTEVHRTSLITPATGDVSYDQATSAASSDNSVDDSISINPSPLVTGINTIAVEVHNQSTSSSDISFDLQMSVTIDTGGLSWGAIWSYLDDGSNQGTAWRSTGFDDSGWPSGAGQLGYGDSDESTILDSGRITYYFRRDVDVDDHSAIATASMDILYDDGAIVYLNGTEIHRTSLITPSIGEVPYDQGTSTYSSDNSVDSSISISPALFITGTNVFAVEVHNNNASSSDISFDMDLVLTWINPNAPSFTSDPITGSDASATHAYSGSISGSATDPNGDPLAYSKSAGPDWLTVASDGTLSGVPGLGAMGSNAFTVEVTDNKDGIDSATLDIEVNDQDGNPVPSYDPSETDRLRLVWVNDPSTTVTIAWDQKTGSDAVVKYGTTDFGRQEQLYPMSKTVDRAILYRGMNNRFARLTGLQPDTAYYFVLVDASGVSDRYWFRTAPDQPDPITFVAGGDSRNNRTPRQKSNRLVSKIRPLFVAFTGDMIDNDNDSQWQEWFDDWQETVSDDGRVYPVLPHRGNHETGGNTTVYNLFDTTTTNYYGITFGGSLLRYYVLNSESNETTQTSWLQTDLDANGGKDAFTHLMAGYHKPMRPHYSSKSEGTTEYSAWAQLFYDNGFDLICESDSHMMKRTHPIRPFTGTGSDEGFITDTSTGTVYIGEGCWGAPLRSADDGKTWTLDLGSFNGFDFIHVYPDYTEVFTIQADIESSVASLPEGDSLSLPSGIQLWEASGGTRLVVNRGATPKLSYPQYQLDSFGPNNPDTDSHSFADYDGDGRSNFMEFAFFLDAANVESPGLAASVLPQYVKGPAGEKRINFRRRANTTVRYSYYMSSDLQNWTLLEEGVDYTESATPGTGYEDLEIELIGATAAHTKLFIRVRYRE